MGTLPITTSVSKTDCPTQKEYGRCVQMIPVVEFLYGLPSFSAVLRSLCIYFLFLSCLYSDVFPIDRWIPANRKFSHQYSLFVMSAMPFFGFGADSVDYLSLGVCTAKALYITQVQLLLASYWEVS